MSSATGTNTTRLVKRGLDWVLIQDSQDGLVVIAFEFDARPSPRIFKVHAGGKSANTASE